MQICLFAVAAAEPEADPALLYSNAFGYAATGYAGYTGYPYAAGYSAYAGFPYRAAYAGYSGLYNPYYAGYARLFKREAEAEADPALLYSGLNYAAPYAYSAYHGYNAFPYAFGAYSTPYAYAAPVAHAVSAPAAIPAVPGAYAAAGRYVANSAGVVHVAKREAEAEAKPFWPYAGYAASPLAYSTFGAYAASPVAYSGVYSPYRYYL